ncbi:MAG: PTS transporter subunit IIC, partial [Anaerolineaceae bacterium]|nr:PTS transporter subunit IIC [Anaerolineaceae bacterium]
MQGVIDFLVQVLQQTSILIGLIALIGFIAQKKPVGATIAGTIKTTLGVIIMGAGANVVVGSVTPLGDLTQAGFNLQGALPVNEVFVALAQQKLGNQISLVFAISFLLSILIARFTPLKYVFLSGHHIIFMSTLTVGLLGLTVFKDSPVMLIIVASVISAISYVISPWLSAPFMEKVIGSKDFVMGHFGNPSYVLAGWLGQYVGDPKDSSEKIKFPEWIGFMKEPLVAMAFVMWIIYMIASVAAVIATGTENVGTIFGNANSWIINSLLQG